MAQSNPSAKPSRLGRGLASLISAPVEVAPAGESAAAPAGDQIVHVPVSQIRPNSRQPRQLFNPESLAELAASIRSVGVMQPIIVRPLNDVSRGTSGEHAYELIAGERRLRAAQLIELQTIPAIVRSMDDRSAAEWALIENVQREDLNAMDRAEAIGRLIEEFGLTHQEVAERLGYHRSTVTNMLRFLEFSEEERALIRTREISFGHARCLLGLSAGDLRVQAWGHIIDDGWSVRELERWVAAQTRRMEVSGAANESADAASGGVRRGVASPEHLQALERRLSQHLGTRVAIRLGRRKGQGTLQIDFYTLEQFEGLLARLNCLEA